MSQDGFNQKKESILRKINSGLGDLSPKGSIDELCLPIIKLVNSHDDMVTSSSCSGRLSVFVEGNKLKNAEHVKLGGKGLGGRWLFVTHDKSDVLNWSDKLSEELIKNTATNSGEISKGTRLVLYKYEPFILHVKCRNFDVASKLYNIAMSCGFRESGIGSNNVVAVRISMGLNIPIGYLNENTGKLNMLVSQDYISVVDALTFGKFEENERKIKELYQSIELNMIHGSKPEDFEVIESKEERRERKRREGLNKQKQVQQEKSTATSSSLSQTCAEHLS
ncbi:HGL038Cp [Eremothecium sinecaudum]|uniref:tRNA wybutosine-synthesizing protein 3 n=1 Tax=Eremothecium sinecaudum TaxID=45286 RepID=A0A0X8HVM3_9SACH|nr:HGL038Cp [Eremothecium sinecaudum]AMD22302.1 HGL038Cp [Eremothecium sinecaudum]